MTTLLFLFWAYPAPAGWVPQPSGTTARLRGLGVVSSEVGWASGTGGTLLRTTDGGRTWRAGWSPVPRRSTSGISMLWTLAPPTLSIGGGDQSRIYKTTDGGATWATVYVNEDPKGFLDALAFWDADDGLALGDPVGGRFVVLTTDDGGKGWNPIPPEEMPQALPGEGAFAASGTCLVVQGERPCLVRHGRRAGLPLHRRGGPGRPTRRRSGRARSSGIFSLAFRMRITG